MSAIYHEHPVYCAIRDEIIEALLEYQNHGVPTGGFLEACLKNDLSGAFGRADVENRVALFNIVSFMYNELDSRCWGSAAKVDAWLEAHAKQRMERRTEVSP